MSVEQGPWPPCPAFGTAPAALFEFCTFVCTYLYMRSCCPIEVTSDAPCSWISPLAAGSHGPGIFPAPNPHEQSRQDVAFAAVAAWLAGVVAGHARYLPQRPVESSRRAD